MLNKLFRRCFYFSAILCAHDAFDTAWDSKRMDITKVQRVQSYRVLMAINIIKSSDLIKVVMTVLFIKLMDITLQFGTSKISGLPIQCM